MTIFAHAFQRQGHDQRLVAARSLQQPIHPEHEKTRINNKSPFVLTGVVASGPCSPTLRALFFGMHDGFEGSFVRFPIFCP